MTVAAKRIVAAYYDSAPKYSYWSGCSAGGRQAMKEAQRFPADYDGIIAGAPGLDWTGRAAQAVRVLKALEGNAAARLAPPQTELLHRAALNACDALDGTKDGLIADPARCTFDPGVLACKGASDTTCLTPAQIETARLIYSPIVNARTKREIAGLAPGSELGWTEAGWTASARATGLDQFRFLVFNDPAWTVQRFDAADVSRAEDVDAGTVNALDPESEAVHRSRRQADSVSRLERSADLAVQQHAVLQPRPRDRRRAGAIANSYRLFMAPGMAHCGGGEGPNTFNMLAALEQWVEQGKAPDRILASHERRYRTRPLCPYPQIAVYNGDGSMDEAANFICKAR